MHLTQAFGRPSPMGEGKEKCKNKSADGTPHPLPLLRKRRRGVFAEAQIFAKSSFINENRFIYSNA